MKRSALKIVAWKQRSAETLNVLGIENETQNKISKIKKIKRPDHNVLSLMSKVKCGRQNNAPYQR